MSRSRPRCLLLSSFTCGLASIAADARNRLWFQVAMARHLRCSALGFLALEVREFADLVARGAGPTRSAFLSAFFTLVGCHGLHVTAGLLWLLTMMAQVFAKGFRPDILRRLLCFSLFWHALDIIWVALFTVVYLLGAQHEQRSTTTGNGTDVAPGDEQRGRRQLARRRARLSASGWGSRSLLTATSFFVAGTDLVWQPSIPVALVVLAIAQMGVHLVFFLHITTGARQHQQRAGAGLRRADRLPADRRLALDHGEPQPQHDADGPDHADAALAAIPFPDRANQDTASHDRP